MQQTAQKLEQPAGRRRGRVQFNSNDDNDDDNDGDADAAADSTVLDAIRALQNQVNTLADDLQTTRRQLREARRERKSLIGFAVNIAKCVGNVNAATAIAGSASSRVRHRVSEQSLEIDRALQDLVRDVTGVSVQDACAESPAFERCTTALAGLFAL